MFKIRTSARIVEGLAFAAVLLFLSACTAKKLPPNAAAPETPSAAETPAAAAAAPQPPAAPVDKQRHFPSPQMAMKVFASASKSENLAALRDILGSQGEEIIASGDPVSDKFHRQQFLKSYQEKANVAFVGDNRALVFLGKANWPFPIPLIKEDGGWRFDTLEGKEEILNRRIGRNELATIDVLHTYVRAQKEYASVDRDNDTILQYATKLKSSPGKHDGLYWPPANPKDISPFGPFIADARTEGYSTNDTAGPTAFHGYLFKILTKQGPAAPDGEEDYMIKGSLLGGFAMVAFPEKYQSSGIMTFIVNQQGKVYQKDLGADTVNLAARITEYNPDETWKLVSE